MRHLNDKFIQLARHEYGDLYHSMRWITSEEAAAGLEVRKALLSEVAGKINWEYEGTKPYYRELSAGCRLCGDGNWSCLFINGICNASCFYCPTQQREQGSPTTNTIAFERAEDYIDYLTYFRFKGVGISGGEPLMTLDRTLLFISRIKKRMGDTLYVWLYTNGILLTESIVGRLKEAGLDEIRFDLGAVAYDLKKLRLAVGHIPHVTVEIPSIPEDEDLLRKLVFQLKESGVHYLNLHHLRCTPHNYAHLNRRHYTLLHGEKVTVLESELAALRLFKFVVDNNLELPLNYCSFAYKNRFQSLAARKRTAKIMAKPYEDITKAFFIRAFSVKIKPENAQTFINSLKEQGLSDHDFCLSPSKEQLFLDEQVLRTIKWDNLPLMVSYFKTVMVPKISYHYPYATIQLNSKKSVNIERIPLIRDKEVPPLVASFLKEILDSSNASHHVMNEKQSKFFAAEHTDAEYIIAMLNYECIQKNLPDYF